MGLKGQMGSKKDIIHSMLQLVSTYDQMQTKMFKQLQTHSGIFLILANQNQIVVYYTYQYLITE